MMHPRLLAALALSFCTFNAHAVDPGELNLITFVNKTGQPIDYIYLSPSDSAVWGPDILGANRTLTEKEDLGFYIHYPNACNDFDIYAVGRNDEAFLVYGYEICDGDEAKVRLTRRNLDDKAPNFSFKRVMLENETDHDIMYLFFSPGDSSMWGVDLLDQYTILTPGDSLELLLPGTGETTRYDVRAVDEDQDTYTFYVEIGGKDDSFTYAIENSDLD